MDKEQEKEFEKKIEAKVEDCCSGPNKKAATQSGSAGAVWFLGFIGAVVYYIQHADGLWGGILGVLKAIVWPAFLVYEAMNALAMQALLAAFGTPRDLRSRTGPHTPESTVRPASML